MSYCKKHITLPNGTNLMSPKDFKTYYQNPTKLEKNALKIAEQLFCYPSCTQNCPNRCQTPTTTHTQRKIHIKQSRINTKNTRKPITNTTPTTSKSTTKHKKQP